MFPAVTELVIKLAEFSNLISAIIIQIILWSLILFFIKYAVMIWLRGEPVLIAETNSTASAHLIPQIKMMRVNIPFTFALPDNAHTAYREIGCKISSQICYRLFAYWGVSIREMHLLLWHPWLTILSEIRQGKMLEGHYQCAGTHFRSKMHSEKLIRFKIPEKPLDLGTPPRLFYPLVIFLVTDVHGDFHPDETVALINIVHIKDQVCTLPTSILAQYLKQGNGQLSCLKQLYMAASGPVHLDYTTEVREGTDQLCVVCQYFPLSRALLPCRHTCICAVCFSKLDTCPMCRSPISSYFCIRSEDYVIDEEKMNTPTPTMQTLTNWFNQRLGFQ
uniref:Putative cell growth regulator with ring finger domain protein 1-like isoform 1 n=1 Tax=Panstrongylus lignarius TaxID=156445 RepID=A0A224XTI1_9HEMI